MARHSEYDTIEPLAERIYATAATLNKPDRHIISDAAKLIEWLCYLAEHPDDAEGLAAVKKLRESIGGNGQPTNKDTSPGDAST